MSSYDLEGRPHFVYRAFDSYGLLLYIGCTVDVAKRFRTHRGYSPWYRYGETVGVWGPYSTRGEALAVEAAAIESESSYFNATRADIHRTQAHRNAVRMTMERRGDFEPGYDPHRLDREGDAYADQVDLLWEAWSRRRDRMREHLKDTSHPYLTAADRVARYLAAREDAELARQEAAA